MSSKSGSAVVDRQAIADDHASGLGSMLVDLLRTCVTDGGWTMDALQAEMRKDKAYIHRVLNGEKPMSWEFFVALPQDVRDAFHERLVEARGQIVVKPVEREDAIRQLVSGLCSVLAQHQFPARASHMAKAETKRKVSA